MDTLSGSVERITYYNPENGYTVLRLRPDIQLAHRVVNKTSLNSEGLATAVGNLPELSPGEHVRLQGAWDNHSKHGPQFKVELCEQTLPATIAGIEGYLGSGMIKGIGPRFAERIVGKFKEDTFDVIEHNPERLLEIPGIGNDRMQKIMNAWRDQKQVKEIMIFLQGHGVSTNLAVKIYKTYGDQALEIVQKNPYQLERDIYGVGFKTADRIAQALGLPGDHPSRIEAGLVFALNEMINEGHVYAPKEVLTKRAIELLEVPPDLIAPGLERLAQDDRIRSDLIPLQPEIKSNENQAISEGRAAYGTSVVYLTPLYHGEKNVARYLCELAKKSMQIEELHHIMFPDQTLSNEQQSAVTMALTNPLSILTGGPGTGKTTCLKALIQILVEQRKTFALASPTGRAAKRLSEATGQPAKTIHRLLEFSPVEGFKHDEHNPLKLDFLIVDEASMLDLLLMNHLLRAIQPGTHLLLVGDVDQLPSVGAGDVLRDMIASGIAAVTRLQTIFRQALDSAIITNAHLINQGKFPKFTKGEGDFFLFPAEDAAVAADWIVNVVAERIPQKFGFEPSTQIQVLSPIYRGPAGVQALNERLQTKLNPPTPNKPERKLYGTVFRVGDKVMQTQNNYDKDVYNGDIGFISNLDVVEQTITVDFDGRITSYDWSETDELTLAYAVSIHKSQGSEFPVVVMPIVTQHYTMLQRNLLYTAITRAKKMCVLAGNARAISVAIRNNKVEQRFTALEWRLGDMIH